MRRDARSPRRRSARLTPLLAAVALLATGAGSPLANNLDDSRWVRRLPGGVSVELRAIGDPEAGLVVWWSPDGEYIAPPLDNAHSVGRTRAGEQVRSFAARVDGPSNDDLVIRWDVGEFSSVESGTAFKDGQPIRGVEHAGVALPAEARTCTIRMRFAAAAWETAATWTPDGGVRGLPAGRNVVFTKPRAIEPGWTAIVVVEDYPDPLNREARVAALGRDGRVLSASPGSVGWDGGAVQVHDHELPGITPDQVARYALQFRPIQSVEFRDVPLVPPIP